MSDSFQLGQQHPDADQLSAFAENALPAYERESVLIHLSTCAMCREAVALSLPPQEISAPIPAAKSGRLSQWFSGWNLALAGGLAFAAISVFAVLQHRIPPPGSPTQTAQNNVAPPKPAPISRREAALSPPPEPLSHAAPPGLPMAKGIKQESFADKAPAAAPSTAAMIDNRSISNLPINNRSYETYPKVTPKPAAPPVVLGGPLSGSITQNGVMAQGAAAAPAPPAKVPPTVMGYVARPAPAQETVNISADTATLETSNAAVSDSFLQPLPAIAALPSHLAVASLLAHGKQTLALDTAGTLFLSSDEGAHWQAVRAPWASHPTCLRLASTKSNPCATVPSTAARFRGNETLSPSIIGIVTDLTGATIPGATVDVFGPSTSSASTDSMGRYKVVNLPPGTYRIHASAPGFSTVETSLAVNDSRTITANVTLPVGSASQTVTVMDAAPTLATRKASRSEAKRVEEMPVFAVETANGEHWTSTDGTHWRKTP